MNLKKRLLTGVLCVATVFGTMSSMSLPALADSIEDNARERIVVFGESYFYGESGNRVCVSSGTYIGQNTWSGLEVKAVQAGLNYKGAYLSVDGIYGSGTQSAIINYQKKNNLSQDGIAGPKTHNSLASACGLKKLAGI